MLSWPHFFHPRLRRASADGICSMFIIKLSHEHTLMKIRRYQLLATPTTNPLASPLWASGLASGSKTSLLTSWQSPGPCLTSSSVGSRGPPVPRLPFFSFSRATRTQEHRLSRSTTWSPGWQGSKSRIPSQGKLIPGRAKFCLSCTNLKEIKVDTCN